MPSKHPSDPAAPLVGAVDDQSKEIGPPENPDLSAPSNEDEKTTVPARRRSPKYVKVLVPGAGCVVRVPDDEE